MNYYSKCLKGIFNSPWIVPESTLQNPNVGFWNKPVIPTVANKDLLKSYPAEMYVLFFHKYYFPNRECLVTSALFLRQLHVKLDEMELHMKGSLLTRVIQLRLFSDFQNGGDHIPGSMTDDSLG